MEICCLNEVNKYPSDDNMIDLILHVSVDEVYEQNGYNESEFPKNAWAIWVTQTDSDRASNQITLCLCNEGLPDDALGAVFTEPMVEIAKKQIYDFIKRENLDTIHGILLNENTIMN